MKSQVMIQRSLVLIGVLLVFSSCNKQEFYKKDFLKGAGDPTANPTPDANDQVDPNSNNNNNDSLPNGGITTTPSVSNPTNNGGSTGGTTVGTTDPSNNGGSTGDTTVGTTDPTNNGGSTGGNGGTVNPGICGDGVLNNASDEFIQNSSKEAKVDILWVMDNSGSMSDEQKALAYNFNAFISNFIEKKIDFKMAITTTDPRSRYSGKMVGDSNKLTSVAAQKNTKKFMKDFSRMIKVGTRGSGDEQGLKTSKDFFDRYRSWAREDAYLVVVYISDEQDHSHDTVSDYITRLQSLKAKKEMVRAYSIVTQSIAAHKKWETLGTRYAAVSKATGGDVADIHQDFYTTLENFGVKILDLLDSFPLSGVPVGSNISVSVNGTNLTNGWSYDQNSRAIKFDKNAIPTEGEVIIAYYQQCVMPN